MPANNGDVLAIPTALDSGKVVPIHWQQSFRSRDAEYVLFVAKNKSQGDAEVVFFVQKEWANEGDLKKVGEVIDGEYRLKIDGKYQYGQKNKAGDMRFVVYHDKSRKQYQNRFVETSLVAAGEGLVKKIADIWGQGGAVGQVTQIANNFIGDYLHDY